MAQSLKVCKTSQLTVEAAHLGQLHGSKKVCMLRSAAHGQVVVLVQKLFSSTAMVESFRLGAKGTVEAAC